MHTPSTRRLAGTAAGGDFVKGVCISLSLSCFRADPAPDPKIGTHGHKQYLSPHQSPHPSGVPQTARFSGEWYPNHNQCGFQVVCLTVRRGSPAQTPCSCLMSPSSPTTSVPESFLPRNKQAMGTLAASTGLFPYVSAITKITKRRVIAFLTIPG